MGNPPNNPWPPQPGQPGPGGGPPYGPPPVPPPGGPPPGMPGGYGPPPGTPYGPPHGPPGPPPPGRKGAGGPVLALLGGGLVVVLIIVAAVVLVLQSGDDDGGGDGGGDVQLRVGKIAGGAEAMPQADGSLVMSRPGVAAPVVDIYEDFACPPCGAFDSKHDPMLKQLVVAGRAKVVFHPMLIFGASTQPAHDNSLRAASALRCVGDGAHWLSYQDALYANQPESESSTGYTTDQLLSLAEPLGLTGDDFTSCVKSQRYAGSVKTVSQGYISSGIQGTPTVRVNGRKLDTSDTASPEALRRAIEAAA
ncbi:thioredoxin domain-containing protein [Actinomadura sp. NAK00032]|uniref:DsbA family protein n=1 Tax=Actinomadura sp. NAK00032 TaxID=2742128 RepID=UPI00159084F7|nr:thioredoxin domain-containing protein [Actinomadura sp. NAK00032]QKW35130.1 thioredoxin domain-containing protein [Actinomadura sp. NAK00032]